MQSVLQRCACDASDCGGLFLDGNAEVARAHQKTGILPPVMTGDPVSGRERSGAHLNTLEWLPHLSPVLMAVRDLLEQRLLQQHWAWSGSVGRIGYFVGYVLEVRKRFPRLLRSIMCRRGLAHRRNWTHRIPRVVRTVVR